MKTIPIDIKVYLVRSQDGKWFRAKGLHGYGESWVDDIIKARIYTKIGSARSIVTWWTRTYPKYGIPDIIEVSSMTGVVLDETSRVKNAVSRIKKEKIEQELRNTERRLKYAEEKYHETLNELKKLQ